MSEGKATLKAAWIGFAAVIIGTLIQASLRSHDAFRDIPVPKTQSIFDSH